MTVLLERLENPQPKRILTLDGGGVRGVLSLEFLERIEAILRDRYGRADFKLCDYFDLISGTSTGAIIAACLALRLSVDEIKLGYRQLATRVFGRRRWKQWLARYDERPLVDELNRVFGDRTLGDSSLKTGLCLILKRADTNSTWPLLNHPTGKYFADGPRAADGGTSLDRSRAYDASANGLRQQGHSPSKPLISARNAGGCGNVMIALNDNGSRCA